MNAHVKQDGLKLTGRVKVFLNDKLVRDVKNLVVTEGKEWIADRMQQDTGSAVMGWMTIGTGTTAVVVGDSTCETQAHHQALTTSGGVVAGAVITFASTFAAGDGTGAITEACITNNTTVDTGDMLARTVFGVVNKAAGDTMTISWSVTIS
jgi:DNA-directed RNA polymerase subunit E'/Rpb7